MRTIAGSCPDSPATIPPHPPWTRPYSEATQRAVDEEVARLLRRAEQRALELLREHRAALDVLSDLLLARETLDGAVVTAVLDEEPRPAADARAAQTAGR